VGAGAGTGSGAGIGSPSDRITCLVIFSELGAIWLAERTPAENENAMIAEKKVTRIFFMTYPP
jgi:hypothetical protein